jgi:hypothetical protein
LGARGMSQEETNNNFSFERKKHFDFFIPYYRKKNWLVVKDNIDSGYKNDWDVKLEIFAGQYALVDEKARKGEYNDFLVEIIQDLRTGNLGWFYGEKDWILYGSWDDLENVYPTSLYLVKAKELDDYIDNLEGFFKTCISKSGWGNTWNLKLEWKELLDKNIAEKLI